MKPTWVVDIQPARRLGMTEEPIVDVIRAQGLEAVATIYDPSHDVYPLDLIPRFEAPQPLILRGSVGFAAWVHDQWPVHPGAFRSENLRPERWLPAYGALALNANAAFVRYADFETQRSQWDVPVFVKPAGGGKRLSGTVVHPGQPLFDAHFATHRRWSEPPDDFRLLVAPARPLYGEWRFVIVGESIVARSQYKDGGGLVEKPTALPGDVFVADIAQAADGFYLLELNTFGTAGLYACNLDTIVQAVSSVAQKS